MNTHIQIIRDKRDSRITRITVGEFPVFTKKTNNGGFAIFSPHFKVLGYSSTSHEDALTDFQEALKCFFDFHVIHESILYALDKLGWDLSEDTPDSMNKPIPKSLISAKRQKFDHVYA